MADSIDSIQITSDQVFKAEDGNKMASWSEVICIKME